MDFSAIASLFSPDTLSVISTIFAFAYTVALAATKLPAANETSSKGYKIFRALIDFIAANYGNAKNVK